MKIISYAQNLEDVMLWRALHDVKVGFYIDVGANDPVIDSVTKLFYESGWNGINIEPLESHFYDLCVHRPRDINLQVAAGSEPGEIPIWDCGVRGWATADPSVVEKHSSMGYAGTASTVQVVTLQQIINEHCYGDVHFLKVDVEGFEAEVIQGIDLSVVRPWVIVIESVKPNSRDDSYTQWEPTLTEANYEHVYGDGLNRYYLAVEHLDRKKHFDYPPNVFDEFITFSEHAAVQCAAVSESKLAFLEESYSEARQEVSNSENLVALMQEQIDNASDDIISLENDLKAAKKQLLVMEHSISWRATKIFRVIKAAIKRLI